MPRRRQHRQERVASAGVHAANPRSGSSRKLGNPDAGPRFRQDLSSGTRRARLRWRLFHGLEHYSRCATAAVMFKFRAEESQAFEQGVFRMTSGGAELRRAAGQHQAARPVFAQSGCAVLAGGNALFGELARTRPPPLCPCAHHSPSALAVLLTGLLWQGKAMRSPLKLLCKAARARGHASAARAESHMKRGVPREAEPRRSSWLCAAAEPHEAALGRAGVRPVCPARSPHAQPLCPRCWGELEPALYR